MASEALTGVGLSPNEVKVYLELLRLKSALASSVAKKCVISRPHVYDTLNNLVEKGLVSYVIKENRKYFRPTNPLRLLEIINEHKSLLESEMPQLLSAYSPKDDKPVVEVYEGKKGMKTILKQIINEAKVIDCFGSAPKISHYLPIESEKFLAQRLKLNIPINFLCSEETTILRIDSFRPLAKTSSSPTTTYIWGDNVGVFVWDETPLIILIKSKAVSISFKNQFQLMWNQNVKTLTGRDGFVENFKDMINESKVLYGFGGLRSIWSELYPQEYKTLHDEKIKLKILTKFIIGEKQFDKKLYDVAFTQTRVIDQKYISPTTIWVWGDKASIWVPLNPPVFTTIENKELAQTYKKQFDLLWKQAKPLY